MTISKNASCYFNPEELKIVQYASKIAGLSLSSFVRTNALSKAREIILKNQMEEHGYNEQPSK